jgi:aerobic C4-dicarboxylate transport protein
LSLFNAPTQPVRKQPFYANLWVQVLIAIVLAVAFGYLSPAKAIAMKPLGDGFIRLITMIISLIIFCSVVSGIASDRTLFQVDGRRNRKGHEIA